MAQTRPSPTLSRGFTRLGRFLAPYGQEGGRSSTLPSSPEPQRKTHPRFPSYHPLHLVQRFGNSSALHDFLQGPLSGRGPGEGASLLIVVMVLGLDRIDDVADAQEILSPDLPLREVGELDFDEIELRGAGQHGVPVIDARRRLYPPVTPPP